MFDVSNKNSYRHAVDERKNDGVEFKTWLKEVRYRYDDRDAPIIFLGISHSVVLDTK